jgi:hypothetical protein
MQSSWWASATRAEKATVIGTAAAVLGVMIAIIAYAFPRGPEVPASIQNQESAHATTAPQPQPQVSPAATSPVPGEQTPTASTTSALATNDPPRPPTSISLSQLNPVSGDVQTDPDSLLGRQYVDLVRQNEWVCGKNYADYNIPAGMATFTADAGLDDTYPDSRSWTFAVYFIESGGTTRIAFKKTMTFGQHASISLNLNGALRVRIGIEYVEENHLVTCAPYSGYSAIWADAKLNR